MDSLIQFGAHKLPLRPGAPPEARHDHSKWLLSRVFSLGTAVAFVGSGCSRALKYPSWEGFTAGLIDVTLELLRKQTEIRIPAEDRSSFKKFRKRLESNAEVSSQSKMFYITACLRILRQGRGPEIYRRYIKHTFSPEAADRTAKYNPYQSLLKLPIRRFVTTNYDFEIERALTDAGMVDREDFRVGREPGGDKLALSFTQEDCYRRELSRFALARVPGSRPMVFHCHGRYDRIQSIVASERDYQDWYLADRGEAGYAFRQTMQLLLHSNPLLFVGYGLEDEDLLRPLRYLGAVDPAAKASRPLFALLPTTTGSADDFHREELLFERYGVKVIPYPKPRKETAPNAWPKALCRALDGLKGLGEQATKQWVQKPLARKVMIPPQKADERVLVHDLVRSRKGDGFIPERCLDLFKNLDAGVVGLVGPSGVGKSVRLASLVAELAEQERFSKIFHWNAHYENEALTGLDLALAYFGADGGGSRHERLLECLREQKILLIVDGCERILKRSPSRNRGSALNANIRRLLHVLADSESRSTVILSGRTWPVELQKLEDQCPQRVRCHKVRPLETRDLLAMTPYSRLTKIDSRLTSALSSLLEGHHYGLLLAARSLDDGGSRRLKKRAERLHDRLAAKPPKKRLATMIRVTLEELDSQTDGLGSELLERLAFFRGPVYEDTLAICCSEARRSLTAKRGSGERSRHRRFSSRKLLKELETSHLLFLAAVDTEERGIRAYMVHDSISTFYSRQGRGGHRQVVPSFLQSGSTAALSGVEPGSRERSDKIGCLFDALHRAADEAVTTGSRPKALRLCRNTYGLVRSQMECASAPRWTDYDRYVRFGIRVADLAKRLSPRPWTFGTRLEISQVEDADAALYIAELAWLYSDVGLALFSEGLMADAFSVWEQGYEINRVLEGEVRPGELVAESLLNLAHSLIELGRIADAEDYLDDADEICASLDSNDLKARIIGFQGLICHLRGNLETAETVYANCLKSLDKQGNPRSASFFNLHRSLVSLERRDFDKARQFGSSARAFAEEAQSLELLAYARIAEADRLARTERVPVARQEYSRALEEARRFKGRKIEALIALKLSELALTQGDSEGARTQGLHCVGLTNELGLGLLQTRGLIALGRATLESGETTLGEAYLNIAEEQAAVQQYWLRHREAERALKERYDRW